MKNIIIKQRSDTPHWVGDGFPVRSIFTYNDLAKDISPFLLMDYASPVEFPPTDKRKGVGSHPHRGFETVTIVYEGEIEHRDSAGGGGTIGKGGVQWMTAASGLVHEEFHGKNYAKTGGPFEMVQLWVNLPIKDKMGAPRYQGINNEQIPLVNLKNDIGSVRVIAGDFEGTKGPAMTFSPINLWDIRLKAKSTYTFNVPSGHTATVFVLSGDLKFENGDTLHEAEIGVLEPVGDTFTIEATTNSKILFLGGAPLNEPFIGYGPFVMASKEELHQAFADFNSGKMGVIGKIEGTET